MVVIQDPFRNEGNLDCTPDVSQRYKEFYLLVFYFLLAAILRQVDKVGTVPFRSG